MLPFKANNAQTARERLANETERDGNYFASAIRLAPMISNEEEQLLIDQIIDRLVTRHPETAEQAVTDVVHTAYHRYDGTPIRDFIPLLVERRAHEQIAGSSYLAPPELSTTAP
jgi:hypothetical protein